MAVLAKTEAAWFDQTGSPTDETTGAKEAKNVVLPLRKAPRLLCCQGLKYGLSGDLAPAAATLRVDP